MLRKCYRINKTGNFKRLIQISELLPDPSSREVTVEVKSIGLNFADIFCILGLYSATPDGSFVPGLEYSGVVVKKGDAVSGFNINDKVMGVIRFGACASHVNADHKYLLQLPSNWKYEEGAAFIINSLTAYYALVVLGNLKAGQTVLINSAAGGVGIYANRIAKKYGAVTIGTVGNENKIDLLKKENCNEIIVREKDFYRQLRLLLNGKYLDIVLESIGGKIFKGCLSQLAPGGRLITYGAAEYASKRNIPDYGKILIKYLTRPKIDPLKLTNMNRSVMGFNLIWLWNDVENLRRMIKSIEELNLGKPYIGKVFSFDELIAALMYLKSGVSVGKVVVNLN